MILTWSIVLRAISREWVFIALLFAVLAFLFLTEGR